MTRSGHSGQSHANPGPTPAGNGRSLLVLGAVAIGVVVAISVGAWLLLKGKALPRLNEPTAVLVKFVDTAQFENLTFEQQREYMRILDNRGNKELEKAFSEGKITEAELRKALEISWFGKHLERMDKYYSESPGAKRTGYLSKLARKKLNETNPDEDPDTITRDASSEQTRTATWPANVQQKWNEFRNAYKEEKRVLEQGMKPAQTRPATVPVK